MISQTNAGGRRRGARLGMTSAMVNGSLVYGASPAYIPARAPIAYPNPGRAVDGSLPEAWIDLKSPNFSNGWGSIPPGVVMTSPVRIEPAWGANPPRWGGAWGESPWYGGPKQSNPNLPTSANNLAQLAVQYQSNPASLSQLEWQQLQAAGVIPGTVPYSNAALVTPTSASGSGIDPATGQSYAAELAAAQAAPTITPTASAASSFLGVDPVTGATTILGLDWYYVVGVALIAAYALSGGKRGR